MLIANLFKHWTYQVFAPGTILREKYEAFKSLLNHDKKAHELMADLEEIYHNKIKVDFKVIEKKYAKLSSYISGMIQYLDKMCPGRYIDLKDYFKKFDFYIRFNLAPPEFEFSPPFTIFLNDISENDHTLAGGKAFNLAIVGKKLKLPMPKGFVITTNAFYYFIEFNDLAKSIDKILIDLDISSPASLNTASGKLVDMIMKAEVPNDIKKEIFQAFASAGWGNGENVRLAMRSSAICEDTKSSFAGQYRTILNVDKYGIIDAYKSVIASKYSPNALSYRINYGLSDGETPMAVLALEMIDAASSGVIYTGDPENPDLNLINIHSVWGLGELLVGGEASPDIINIAKGKNPEIIKKQKGPQTKQMIFSKSKPSEIIPLDDEKKKLFSLDDVSALDLSSWGIKLENFFGVPQDIEWCKDKKGRLFLLQSRPLKIEKNQQAVIECNFQDVENAVLVSKGETACSGIGAGKVFKIKKESDLEQVHDGAVLVARNALPEYIKVINRLSAVVTDTGSKAGHFASVAREFAIPTIVNTGIATSKLPEGEDVTVYADACMVYKGIADSLTNSPCAKKDLLSDSPFMRRLGYVMSFISPLKLVDPEDESFVSHKVRSLHDIIRFVHEKAVQEMFQIGEKRIRKGGGARKLVSRIPMLFYVVDVGGGLCHDPADKKTVMPDEILSTPMTAILKGLNHPGIKWSEFTHFDWAEYDKILMSGGMISKDSAMLASYAVLSRDYLNLNLRFGYHFVIIDSICGHRPGDNYILFRFSGGGDDIFKRMLRAEFLKGILEHTGFKTDMKNDLIDAEFKGGKKELIEKKLDILGRLIGATRLMDMYLKDREMVEKYIDEFMDGRYHFASIEK